MKDKYQYPEWAENAIWYQIFPERFCRKNNQNPISAEDIEGTTPFLLNRNNPWHLHDWTSDWYVLDNLEKQNNADLKNNILRRRYGGDINGIISKLDYLKDLGVNALYINPLQYSPSLHKYDGTNFLHIDPFFGSDSLNDKLLIENEDFEDFENTCWTTADKEALLLINQAHKREIKIIFDGVFNHIGYNSKPFQDVLKNREKSKYADWFIIDFKKSTKSNLYYQKFWGSVKEMPKLNYSSNKVKEYVFATLKRWLKPIVEGKECQGIDGWRIDHAIGVPLTFWKEASKFVKKIKPDSIFIGELIEPEEIIKPYLQNRVFDTIMNYEFLYASCQFFCAEKNYYSSKEFSEKLEKLLKNYPISSNYLMQNILGTHDTERISSYIVNRKLKNYGSIDKYFQNSHASDKNYSTRKPYKKEREIQKMMIIFQFSFVGTPMIYYGDEVGMWGANDPDCRKPMIWAENKYQDEKIIVNGIRSTKYNTVKIDKEIFLLYKQLIEFRKTHKSLTKGDYSVLYSSAENRVFAFSRKYKSEQVIFIFNRENKSFTLSLNKNTTISMQDFFTRKNYSINKIKIDPFQVLILS
ncbi:MAG: glycoside hydrolase family 13 protein [Bacteroidales bacterium]|nr:glycoside hydrolase family 13 protein [Bacteroidales bacterium]